MALPLTETDKFLLLSAVGAPETRDRISALLDLAGTGNMTGPASATDNALVRFDGTTGALVQNSGIIADDSNNLSGIALLSPTTLRTGDGTAGSPAFSFTSDTNTGIFRSGADVLAFSTGGSNRLSITSTDLQPLVPFLSQFGSASNPTYSFISDEDTGVFRGSANTLSLSAGGTERFRVNSVSTVNFVPFYAFDGTSSAPGITFNADTDSGFFRVGSNSLGLSLNATQTFQWNPTFSYSFVQLQGPNGSAATPSFSFNSDVDTGLYRIGDGNLGFSSNGTLIGEYSSAGLWTIGASGGTQTHVVNGSLAMAGGKINANNTSGGIQTRVSIANVSSPPTNAELVATFGAASTNGAGWLGVVDDNNSGAATWLIAVDNNSNYWYVAMTKAV